MMGARGAPRTLHRSTATSQSPQGKPMSTTPALLETAPASTSASKSRRPPTSALPSAQQPPSSSPTESKEDGDEVQITPYQTRVYALLRQIPAGRVSTYAALSRALESSPRAVGGALRRNPFAPETPCHRVIGADGYIGGFKGEWHQAPSGINTQIKLQLLKREGVQFDDKGKLKDTGRLWAQFEV